MELLFLQSQQLSHPKRAHSIYLYHGYPYSKEAFGVKFSPGGKGTNLQGAIENEDGFSRLRVLLCWVGCRSYHLRKEL